MKHILTTLILTVSVISYGQNISGGTITGNMESTFQYLNNDTLIGANQPAEKGLLQTYANAFYTNGGFKAGLRIESYLPRIQGYPDRFSGTGIGMRYVGYSNDFVDVTLGNFYEQFGSGMIFRSYEDRTLGYDSAMDGIRLILRPYKGVTVKAVYGRQRFSFTDGNVIKSDGIVRGFDGEAKLNEIFPKIKETKWNFTVGGAFVSKYQEDKDENLVLPENVGAFGGRAKITYGSRKKGKFSLSGEYNHKINDPSGDNAYIYNTGHASIINLGFSKKGIGVLLSAKSIDNMSFRSDRTKDLQDLLINFLPPTNKTHTYNLVATLYPYATQPLGEVAYQGDIVYTIPKKSKLGGKYGMPITVNYSTIYQPNRNTDGFNAADSTLITYASSPFSASNVQYWQDINFSIYRKFGKKFNMKVSYYNLFINNDVVKVSNDAKGNIVSNIGVIEMAYKINRKNSIRVELQALATNERKDKGDWATGLIEYTISPSWFFSVMDQYNFGNNDPSQRIHYIIGTAGYIKGSTRITASYGRQREGLFCVGGVCRFVPASNGLTLSFTQSF